MRTFPIVFLTWIAAATLQAQTTEVDAQASLSAPVTKCSTPATEARAVFSVRSHRGGPAGEVVAAKCASLRSAWHERWMSGQPVATWESPCEVVIHAHRQSYLSAVGRAGGSTLGSSLVRRQHDGSVTRRIDLLTTENGDLPALAHELTHVILADQFPHGSPPLWIDEGLAMLLDSPRKQSLHLRDCGMAIQSGTRLPLKELLHLDRPTSPAQFPAVYGQSLMLTRFFTSRAAPEKLLEFVRHSQSKGYDDALRAVYGIRSWDELELEWRSFVHSELGNS
jgi:hypothetical protein